MSANRDLKITKVAALTDKLRGAKVVVLADYTGLTVAQINDLRTKIKAAGGDLQVTKNTLLRIALTSATPQISNLESQISTYLAGPTAVVLGITDESPALKALALFAKASGIPSVKAGFLGDRILSADEVNTLATLPARESLIGQLLGLLNSPMTGLVRVLNGNQTKLVYILSQIGKRTN